MVRKFLVLGLLFLLPEILSAEGGAPDGILTSCKDIRNLSRREVMRELPVRVRGVITLVSDDGGLTVDDGVGIWVNTTLLYESDNRWPLVVSGDLVEIRGRSHLGLYAPIITAESMTVLGNQNLPEAKPIEAVGLALGTNDCQRVKTIGVVEEAEVISGQGNRSQLTMLVATMIGRFRFDLKGETHHSPSDLVNSEVSLAGVFVTERNASGQFIGWAIQTNHSEDLVVIHREKKDVFDVQRVELHDVMAFSSTGPNLHRQLVQGVVTLSSPGRYFFLQDEMGASLKVNTTRKESLQRGEIVEASGFFHLDDERAEMFAADFRKVDGAMSVVPLATTATELVNWTGRDVFSTRPDYDGLFILLRGRLLAKNWTIEEMPSLTLESDGIIVPVEFCESGDFGQVMKLRLGSELEITGVCSLTQSGSRGPESGIPRKLSLLLQRPEDIRVVNAASWWTQGRLLSALVITGMLLIFFIGWWAVLRRAVEVKSARLASEMRARRDAEIEFDTTLRERSRFAADLHDSTEQALTGLAMQLEVCQALHDTKPSRSRGHLAIAFQILDQCRESLRRSIWNLRESTLGRKNFLEALQDIAEDRSKGFSAQISVECQGDPQPVEAFVTGNLLMLAQEGITNAIKHSNATQIGLKVEFLEESVSLTIWDDGIGFDPQTADGMQQGHFGLQGMRERIKRLSGSIDIRSSAGQGTSVIASAPY